MHIETIRHIAIDYDTLRNVYSRARADYPKSIDAYSNTLKKSIQNIKNDLNKLH